MSFTDYYENRVLALLFKGATYWLPRILVDLCKSDPSERGGLDVPSHESYESQEIAPGYWEIIAPGTFVNTIPVWFPKAEADWGEMTHLALSDAEYYNKVIAYGPLVTPMSIVAGLRPCLAPGDLMTILN